eukprot:EG_transcript_11644
MDSPQRHVTMARLLVWFAGMALVSATVALAADGRQQRYAVRGLRQAAGVAPSAVVPQVLQVGVPAVGALSANNVVDLQSAGPAAAAVERPTAAPGAAGWAMGLAVLAPLAALVARWGRRPSAPLASLSPLMGVSAADGSFAAVATVGRREALAAASVGVAAWGLPDLRPALAATGPRVVVAGATGATGKLTVEALKAQGADVVAGVRNVAKAASLGVPTVPLDITGRFDALVDSLKGVDVVVSCIGFTPGNPFEFSKAAHAVDNVGMVALVDAAKAAGVKRFILMSSILTNGRALGLEKNPGFVITNAFGGVLDEKLVAEKHLRASGLEWLVVRPGGLEGGAAEGEVAISSEDTLFSGTISRALVAEVLAAAAVSPAPAFDRVVEIVQAGTCATGTCPADLAATPKEQWFA